MDFYGEYSQKYKTSEEADKELIASIDWDRNTLMEAMTILRSYAKDVINTTRVVNVYIISGGSKTVIDGQQFSNYLTALSSQENIKFKIILRGVFGAEILPIFISDNDVLVSSDSKFYYDRLQLHDILVCLLAKKEVYDNFLSLFAKVLKDTSYLCFDIQALKAYLGLTLKEY